MTALARAGAFGLVMALVLTACSGGDDALGSTTTSAPEVTVTSSAAPPVVEPLPTTTPTDVAVTTTRLFPEGSLPGYDIVFRETGEEGDTVVVQLDPDTYSSLSDIDVHDVIADVYERFPPVLVAYLVDTEQAAEYVLLDAPDADQQAHLAVHYFARLEDGLRIVYQGPLAHAGVTILGS
jgi:hypothetical protein